MGVGYYARKEDMFVFSELTRMGKYGSASRMVCSGVGWSGLLWWEDKFVFSG